MGVAERRPLTEAEHPRIEVQYMLRSNEALYEPVFRAAAARYGHTRLPEEQVYYESHMGDDYTFIRLGQRVIVALSYAEMSHQADVMQAEFEAQVTHYHGEDVLEHARAGQQLSGMLPDPE